MSIQNRRPRRRSLLQLVLLAALPATFLALSAAPSGAVTITSISPSTTVASGTTLTVAGTQDSVDEHYYFVAVCGQSTPLGRNCDAASAVGPVFPSSGTWHAGPVATKTFTNTSFIPGLSPTAVSTTCKSSAGDSTAGRVQCHVVVSAYNTSGTQIGFTSEPIFVT